MKIGIVEIMPIGHYTLVDSVTRIYGSDIENEIFLFIHKNGEKNILPLVKLFSNRLKLQIWDGHSDLKELFRNINQTGLDKCYFITFEKFFKEFYSFNFTAQLNVFIHNVDQWFQADKKYILYHLLNNVSSFNDFLYRIKVNTIHSYYRRRIISKLLKSKSRFVVLNPVLIEEINKFLPEEKIDFIPFSVYNLSLEDKSHTNKILRVCIPGMISEIRRDYYSIIDMIEKDIDFFSKKIEFDFLGGITNKEGGEKILAQLKRLLSRGVKINFYNKPLVPVEEFDEQLTKADVILGNIKINVDKYSAYGKTKETGIPFTMIRAAKPGLLPRNYPSFKELESSTLRFSDYNSLSEIIRDIVINKSILLKLKDEALKNSLKFEPAKLYHELVVKQL
jgi:hypothetical protein